MSKYRTYKKEAVLCFIFSVTAYFLPFIIVTCCLLPMVKATDGFKAAIGLGVVFINAIPFLMGIFRAFFAHFPMFNVLAVVFLMLAAFFMLDTFRTYAEIFLWIEFAAATGSIASCILWGRYKRYAESYRTVKANVKSGAFVLKEESDD